MDVVFCSEKWSHQDFTCNTTWIRLGLALIHFYSISIMTAKVHPPKIWYDGPSEIIFILIRYYFVKIWGHACLIDMADLQWLTSTICGCLRIGCIVSSIPALSFKCGHFWLQKKKRWRPHMSQWDSLIHGSTQTNEWCHRGFVLW